MVSLVRLPARFRVEVDDEQPGMCSLNYQNSDNSELVVSMKVTLEIDEATLSALRDGAVGKVVVVTEGLPEPSGPPKGPLAPLMDAGLLKSGAVLHWNRPRRGERYEVVVLRNGQLEAPGGQRFNTPSGATDGLAGGSNDGWECWRTDDGDTLGDLRKRLRKR